MFGADFGWQLLRDHSQAVGKIWAQSGEK